MEKMTVFGDIATEDETRSKDKSPAFGIDLGTTNSCISVISGGVPEVIPLQGGRMTLPSCVMWKGKKGEFIVGQEAYANRYKRSAIYSVKRMMGSGEKVTLRYGMKEITLTPAEVSAEILKELVRQISDRYKVVKDVVITVPAYFNNNQIADTLEAGRLAGLNVLNIFREPTSAALAYDLEDTDEEEGRILAYDLGGGTFDVSLVRFNKQKSLSDLSEFYGDISSEQDSKTLYTVLDTDGDSQLGGDDIDMELYNILEKKLADQGHDVSKIPQHEKERIVLRLERIKKMGPGSYTVPVNIRVPSGERIKEDVVLEYSDFTEATRRIYRKTKEKIDAVLMRNDISKISAIVLVGGSTKSEILQSFLQKDFPNVTINNALNPDESVALGAAIQAAELKFGDRGIEVFDILPLSIGVLSDGYVKPIIRKNQRVPYSNRQLFSTIEDYQEKIEIHVFQGNSPIQEESIYLGTVELTDIPKKKAGEVSIHITLSVDSNGLLNVSVVTDTSSKQVDLVNIFGRQAKATQKRDKRVLKWISFANSLELTHGLEAKEEVLDAIYKFESGKYKTSDVVKVISKYSASTVEITKPERPADVNYEVED